MEGDLSLFSKHFTNVHISIHSLRMEGDATDGISSQNPQNFNPLPPHGGRPTQKNSTRHSFKISIHSLRMEGDIVLRCDLTDDANFNPLPPHGGRHCQLAASTGREKHFNPLPPHGGRHGGIFDAVPETDFNPLPPHGGRLKPPMFINFVMTFQSTPSAWRETRQRFHPAFVFAFQSTPSAWRETAKLHRKAFFISPILVQSCKKGCKRLHSAPEKMIFFEKREKNSVRNLQHLSVRL